MAWENLPSTNTPLNATNLNQINQYSTTEIVVGKWIDNKTIYRKVISLGTLPNATSAAVDTGLSNINIIKIYGFAVASNNTTIPLPFTTTTEVNNVSLSYSLTNKIAIQTGVNRSEYTGYAILEYTKNS